MIDEKGTTLIPFIYKKIKRLDPPYFLVAQDNLYAIADEQGQLKTAFEFQAVDRRFMNKRLLVKQKGLYGYLDEQLQWSIPAQYLRAARFDYPDHALVQPQEGSCYFIDSKGQYANESYYCRIAELK